MGKAIELPIEIILYERPVSYNVKGKRVLDWKTKISAEANKVMDGCDPIGYSCDIQITYFYRADQYKSGLPDADNIIKPIQDALNTIVFVDDKQATDVKARVRDLDGLYRVSGITPSIAIAFSKGIEFTHILIRPAPDHSYL